MGSSATPQRPETFGLRVSRLLLDTSVLIDALRGRAAAERLRALRRQGVEPWVSAVSIEEVWRGLRPEEEIAGRRMVEAMRLAPLGVAEARRSGRWRREYAADGITLHQADCLIAASAIGVGAALATANVRDFPMPEVDVQDWPSTI